MKVQCNPSDWTGCGLYRLRWVAAALKAQGADINVVEQLRAMWESDPLGGPPLCRGAEPIDADVIVVQRVFDENLVIALRDLQRQGVKVIVDIDDDFFAVDTRHPLFAEVHPKLSPNGLTWNALREVFRFADLITVSTPALQRKYGGVVIRNCVPAAYLELERTEPRDRTPVIGWTGYRKFHPGDLEVLDSAIADVCRSGAATFRAIGGKETLDVLGVPDQEHNKGAPPDRHEYARLVAQLDIGIVPLAPTRFNDAKSWLKGLEMSSVGVPFVASPSAEYAALHALGVGAQARRPRHWVAALRSLAESADKRAEMAAAGRAFAARWTIEGKMTDEVWSAWSSVLGLRATAAG